MRRVLCFGEALIDFLNTGEQADGVLSLNNFRQYPGGAPANAAVAVAKLGGKSQFAGQVGDDPFGHFLIDALKSYGVNTDLTAIHPSAKTTLAFVFLDEKGERSFAFHRDNTADVVFTKDQVGDDWFKDAPILHFCSNTLTDANIAAVTEHIVDRARQENAIVSFDVNLRHNLWPTGEADKTLVNALVHKAHIVKFAREELDYLSNNKSEEYLKTCFSQGVKLALVTDGGGDVSVSTADTSFMVSPPSVKAVDTTGGGDGFIGAILYGLSEQENLDVFLASPENLQSLVAFATHCGALTVTRQGAFPALPTFDEVSKNWILS